MNYQAIKAKMDAYFATATPEQIISEMEGLGVEFVDVDEPLPELTYHSKYTPTIYALSRRRFEEVLGMMTEEQREVSAFISIHDINLPEFEPNQPNWLNLRFDDIDIEEPFQLLNGEWSVPFTPEMAVEVSNFVSENVSAAQWFIHCSAGKCRSGAISEWISERFGIGYFDFKRVNPQVQPNILVKRLLNNTLTN